jgi:pyruvate dehydrogenase E2 component (dihydrolipoamide acetyltransferase)
VVAEKPEQLVQPSRMRRTIARRMVQSKQTVPHFYVTVEVDMKAAGELRTSLNALEGERPKITFTDMIVKAAAIALTKVPQAGTQYQEEGLKPPSGMHIGIAVALDDGLVVPVLRDADKKTLLSIARETKELAERARQGKLKPDEYSGGVLSISNLGMFDVESFSAIINPPEAAILAVGSILEVPAVVNGEITIRPRMKVTMSADHRVLDGVVAAKFLQEFKRALEQPLSLLE